MSERPENSEEVARWIEKAENDFRNAEHTLTLEVDCPFDTVCFHAQQCAEKYLKALLVSLSVDFPKTHDLRLLMQRVAGKITLDIEISDVLVLNRYSIEARYPGDWEPIDRDEAEKAVAIARQIRKRVRANLLTKG
ncbi:MAG: hypothetical protein COW52_05155 [Nitrospirae bacterium CG17_big_fil_post_rev_8_21_14_2_50_50_9]|nr:MAG: hypothetical protein AUK29_03860 [Nitrospirae bacterium CG2_30_53_67]PIV84897.1 MAG: hypothetical protein COW52_05155 [Nitrospirae bacterium CG17_big_fil_post_rev_8_21_14_2_50_50_9]